MPAKRMPPRKPKFHLLYDAEMKSHDLCAAIMCVGSAYLVVPLEGESRQGDEEQRGDAHSLHDYFPLARPRVLYSC